MIDKAGVPPAHVQYSGVGGQSGRLQQFDGHGRQWFKPADIALAFRVVEALPLTFTWHHPSALILQLFGFGLNQQTVQF